MSKPAHKRPRLAIVSSYGETCANASYAKMLEDTLGVEFDVEVLNLKSTALMKLQGEDNVRLADQHIDSICERLKEFDVVNVHLEKCLYGLTLEHCVERIIRLCNASERLILTVHKIYLEDHCKVQSQTDVEIYNCLKQRTDPNSYHVIVHIPREKDVLKRKYGIENVTDFPCLFLSDAQREYYKAKHNPTAWKKSIGLSENDITIGRFGLLNDYKDHLIALRLLKIMPEQYKVVYVGGAHPGNIKPRAIDPVIKEMTEYLDNNPEIAHRVIFMGSGVSDEAYHTALCNIDFVVVPHYETWQSASAVTSVALELCRPIITSYNFTFMEYAKYFPDCFEMFNMGNHYEIKYKIMNFDYNKVKNLEIYAQKFTLSKIVDMYRDIYNKMKGAKHTAVLNDPSVSPRILQIMQQASGESPLRRAYQKLPESIKQPLRKLKQSLVSI